MKRIAGILVATLVCIFNVFSQENYSYLFDKNGEIYFTFELESENSIHELSKIISIDNVKGNTVFAYANEKEFKAFLKLGLEYTLLPHPNEGFDPTMATFEQIKNAKTWEFYPTYDAYIALMYQFESDYPDLCDVFSIGQSINGREILVAKISDNISMDENEPEFFYTSSMHGDELTGFPLMLNLIDSLLANYGTVIRMTNLVDNIEIYINPLANPDGTYAGGNSSVSSATRYNANNVDLNRNYPDPDPNDGPHPDGNAWQTETIHFMNFAESRDFVMSANFHGGAEVCNYPWDTWSYLNTDDSWWQYISNEYADTAQLYSPTNYMNGFNDGITNGYAWYPVAGGRQDFMNYFHQCREETFEISDTKLIPESQIQNHWEYNRRSLLNYMEHCLYGIRGLVTDADNGQALEAEIYILNHDVDSSWVYSSLPAGNYHRPIMAGTYDVQVSAPGYFPQILNNISVTNKNTIVLDFQLVYGDTIISDYLITNGSVTTCIGNFYDSGGLFGDYSDDENYEMTFFPSSSNGKIKVEFTSFDVEYHSSCSYDWLSIYDGPDASLTLIDTYCGTNSPGEIVSTHESGALTFVFYSDISVTAPGWEALLSCEIAPLEVDLKVFLEGPFNGIGMSTSLNSTSFIPLSQPYNTPPWNYTGTETVGTIPNPEIVDWILIELRDAPDAISATAATTISQQAAFLLNNGDVVGLDGTSMLLIDQSYSQSLFVIIWHRNHLGMMSAMSLLETAGIYNFDFTTGSDKAFGINGQKHLGGGFYGMIAGDANADGVISNNDGTDSWYLDTGQSGYLKSDVNLNGESNNQDKNNYWYFNLNKTTQVPE